MRLIQPDPTVFLTAANVPPNLCGLHEGDRVTLVRERRVVRAGYRLTPADMFDEADALLCSTEGRIILQKLRALCGATCAIRFEVARSLVRAREFGGRERGLLVEDVQPAPEAGLVVQSVRVVQLGDYYPPSGGGEDYECGGLSNRRTVVLVRTDWGEIISGDLVRLGAR